MGFLRRKRGGDETPSEPGPDWAYPMSAADVDAFKVAVGEELEQRGLPHEVGEGMVRLERGGEWSEYGLTNLAQFCQQVGRADWREAITTHFDNLFEAADADEEFQKIAGDFDAIRSLLKVRLYPSDTFEAFGEKGPARWELATGLTAAFVFDLPTTVRTANVEDVDRWGRGDDEVLAVALENVRRDEVEAQPIAEGPSAPIACFADHFFAASHALLLGERLPPEANGHAVFAVPHRHALLYAPMADMAVVESVHRLILTAISLYEEGPGSISPNLYWWRDGSIQWLPTKLEGSDVQLFPPDEFVEKLETLPS